MEKFGMNKWATFATMVFVLACCHVCRSQSPSEIVVFDASQSNPGGWPFLVWPEWLASQFGISTPTENGTAYWTVPIRNLDTEVTNYLAAQSPTADSLVVIGNIFPDDVEPAEYALEMSTQVPRLAEAGVQNFVIHRIEYLTHTMIGAPFRESVAETNAALDPALSDLQRELGSLHCAPSVGGIRRI